MNIIRRILVGSLTLLISIGIFGCVESFDSSYRLLREPEEVTAAAVLEDRIVQGKDRSYWLRLALQDMKLELARKKLADQGKILKVSSAQVVLFRRGSIQGAWVLIPIRSEQILSWIFWDDRSYLMITPHPVPSSLKPVTSGKDRSSLIKRIRRHPIIQDMEQRIAQEQRKILYTHSVLLWNEQQDRLVFLWFTKPKRKDVLSSQQLELDPGFGGGGSINLGPSSNGFPEEGLFGFVRLDPGQSGSDPLTCSIQEASIDPTTGKVTVTATAEGLFGYVVTLEITIISGTDETLCISGSDNFAVGTCQTDTTGSAHVQIAAYLIDPNTGAIVAVCTDEATVGAVVHLRREVCSPKV